MGVKNKLIAWIIYGAIEKDGIRRKLVMREVIKVLDQIKNKLSGYKTYIVAGVAILGAVLSWVNGQIDSMKMIELVTGAILAMTVRDGIAKVKK